LNFVYNNKRSHIHFSQFHKNGPSVYKYGGLNCFIEYLHRKLLTANFQSYDIDSAKKVHLLDLHIKTMNVLFYNYVFNSS
jgi:hypothetical protein